MCALANPVARGAIHQRPSLQDVTERLRLASMAEGGLDVDKLVSDLIRVVEIDRRLNELERRLAAAPSGNNIRTMIRAVIDDRIRRVWAILAGI